MKIFLFTFAIFGLVSDLISQQDEYEAKAHIPSVFLSKSNNTSQYFNVLFPNKNISQNTGPQNEPSVRISRVNPNIVVAAWRDFRLGFQSEIVRRIGYSYSTDGGLTWAVSQLIPDPNPDHTSQSDPVLTNDAQGYFYLSSTSRKPVAGYNRDMLIYRSTNNGQSFHFYSIAVPGSGGAGEDKEWIFCDPVQTNSTYNNIFISWTSFGPQPGIKFRKSINSGLNWSSTVNVSDNSSGQGSNICSGTNGAIYMVWDAGGIKFDKSTNGGANFGTDYQLSNVSSTKGFPFICCDYSNNSTRGNVYIVWDDMRNGSSDVWFQRSTNGGTNWLAAPVRVNDVTTNHQYWPVIQCDINGILYVIYYDNRLGTGQVNSYLAYSIDAGNTWINQQLSDSTFSAVPVGGSGGDVRYGDYIGVDAFNGKVITVWTDDRKGTPDQEIYTANLSGLISVTPVGNEIPVNFKLYQNYPNPFNPETKINFDLPVSSFVKISIFDILGRQVKILVAHNLQPGKYSANFNAVNLSAGVYFYKIEAGNFIDSKKLILIK
ncbi:MAG: T9SS type A sorting domain-containing protein [Ignavibacteria bacterium]|nr:T9SS type A sorting domain-containing protein [Ignavibacteria bacterium]